jgi:hypothetical protein
VDPTDDGEALRVLFYLDHGIEDGRVDKAGNRRLISRQLQFVEMDSSGAARSAGYAPYLDYRPATAEEQTLLAPKWEAEAWLKGDLETAAKDYAVTSLAQSHLHEVRTRREDLVVRTMAAVKDRLTKEINYWDHRANQLKDQELAGKVNAKINSGKARQRADELQARLQSRMAELEKERQISALPPVVIGGTLVVPAGLLRKLQPATGPSSPDEAADAENKRRIEKLAVQLVMQTEENLGFKPRDVSRDKCGYDIESKVPETGRLRFIEVKGRVAGAATVTVTRNEILTALNKPDDFILALAEIDGDDQCLRYVRQPFRREPDFGVESVNYKLPELLARGEVPA